MIKNLIIFLLLQLPVINLLSQNTDNVIVWSNAKLSWADFKEKPGYDKYPYKLAKTRWRLDVIMENKTGINEAGKVEIKITALFIPENSWVRNPQIIFASLKVLAHEQLHFDIVELYARKMRMELQSANLTKSNYQNQIRKIKNRLLRKLNSVQEDYDFNVTGDDMQQSKWQKKIADEIAELNDYANPLISILVE